jgi:hypothetical protein
LKVSPTFGFKKRVLNRDTAARGSKPSGSAVIAEVVQKKKKKRKQKTGGLGE